MLDFEDGGAWKGEMAEEEVTGVEDGVEDEGQGGGWGWVSMILG